jgi:prepilin-type N-terminal cleavage/methylation domain-containing protein
MTHPPSSRRAFTLVELMLALTIGLALFGVIVQTLLASARVSGLASRRYQAKAAQRRTLELLRSEALQALRIRTAPAAGSDCATSGRVVVLELETEGGRISYSFGAPPSEVWSPQVLMRCGPAYGLHGQLSSGNSQNRVVIDRLTPDGFTARRDGSGRIEVILDQQLSPEPGSRVSTTMLMMDDEHPD